MLSPIGLGVSALALYLGAISVRFWWHGLATLLGVTLFFGIISIAAMQLSPDPMAQNFDYSFSPARILSAWLGMLLYALPFYGVARGIRWLIQGRGR